MNVLLVIALIIIAIFMSNFLVKMKQEDEKKSKEEQKMKFKDFLLLVKEMDPEIELSFLLEYYNDSFLSDEDKEKIEMKLTAFATNYSYFVVKRILELELLKLDNMKDIEYLENLVIETGFPSVFGLSKAYMEEIESLDIRNHILSLVVKLSKINILKFIEFVEDDISKNNIIEEKEKYFLEDKKTLLEVLQKREKRE